MFLFILAYIKVKSPDTSSSILTPPATTSTPINWISNKWNNQQFHVSSGKLLFQEQTNNIILMIC